MELWEVLVPCNFGDNNNPVRVRHHRIWDEFVRNLSGGLTLLRPSKGQWVHPESNLIVEDRVIPVRIACSEKDIISILGFTKRHYRQECIMAYQISNRVIFYKE